MSNTRIAWNKGKKLTEEHRNNLSLARLGKVPWNKGVSCSDDTKQKLKKAHEKRAVYGSKHPLWKPPTMCKVCNKPTSRTKYEYCIKCRSIKKPKQGPLMLLPKCIDCGKQLAAKNAKRCQLCTMNTPERKRQNSLAMSKRIGELSPKYIKDRTKLKRSGADEKNKRSSAYKDWSRQVKQRDNWTCQLNSSDCKGRLESHHIKSYTFYPEDRYEVNNGACLCHFHHRQVHKQITENHIYLVLL